LYVKVILVVEFFLYVLGYFSEGLSTIVLKLGSVIDSAGVLGHWVNGRTTESLVEPHDGTGSTRITRLDNPVLRLNLYSYLTGLNRI